MRVSAPTYPIVCLAAFLLLGLGLLTATPFPGEFDELQHISYAAFLQEHGGLLPRFERQTILAADDLRRWTERANYVGHPSPFYLYLQPFLDRSRPPAAAALPLRLASAALLGLGVALTLGAGWRQFAGDRWALPVFCLMAALCPKLVAVASQVTNDSLAFLGGALAYWGASARHHRPVDSVALAFGLVLALWAKPNAGLLVGTWLGLALLLRAPRPRGWLLGLLCGALVGSLPYLHILATYRRLVPVTAEQLGYTRLEQLGGFADYLPAFLHHLGFTWPIMQNGGWITVLLFWALVAGIVLAGRFAWSRRSEAGGAIAAAAPISFLLILPIHLWFASSSLGYSLPAASFRYYLPLWPALAHALAFGVMAARSAWSRAALAAVGLAALLAGWTSP